jgi:hypothetical protein
MVLLQRQGCFELPDVKVFRGLVERAFREESNLELGRNKRKEL